MLSLEFVIQKVKEPKTSISLEVRLEQKKAVGSLHRNSLQPEMIDRTDVFRPPADDGRFEVFLNQLLALL